MQFRHLNFDQNFYQVFCLNACQIQSSLPPSVLQAGFLPEAQLGVYELLGSCHLMVSGCWRKITLTQSIFSRWVFIYNEKFLCQYYSSELQALVPLMRLLHSQGWSAAQKDLILSSLAVPSCWESAGDPKTFPWMGCGELSSSCTQPLS